jgi:hypothetical protein
MLLQLLLYVGKACAAAAATAAVVVMALERASSLRCVTNRPITFG